ncbi:MULTISPECIES: DUF3379 family protein [unclassified Agarivorans]|uniref:DUF3379 family protein n=1 Tax=unclassified Agarivorans TaxID=2636026 RepID=UPI0010F6BC45|nr:MULTISPECIES: DUF3379 family protein [unclassified Agarivorans]MDO6763977.1 DUF3379 family protein [Agarivorans sp. 1_MG-2023]
MTRIEDKVMDELEFRRQLYTNPRERSDALIEEATRTPKNKKLFDDMQQFECKLEQALNVEVPDALAERLILSQSFDDSQVQYRRKTRVHIAMAASIAFVIGLSFSLVNWQVPAGYDDMGQVALQHVYHEMPYTSGVDEQPSLQTINAKLARYGASFDELPGDVVYVNHCAYAGSPAFHMIMKGKMGSNVNVFVVPKTTELQAVQSFADKKMHGMVGSLSHASLVVVGERNEPIEKTLAFLTADLNQAI